jgi:hypothetical protein
VSSVQRSLASWTRTSHGLAQAQLTYVFTVHPVWCICSLLVGLATV